MTQKQADKDNGNGARPTRQVVPEVIPQAQRRLFTTAYTQWVLAEADKCREERGQIGALLRREGLNSSHLSTWWRQREAGQMAGLKARKRGRKADEEAVEMSRLRLENERVRRDLRGKRCHRKIKPERRSGWNRSPGQNAIAKAT